jgi:hypothetical protein
MIHQTLANVSFETELRVTRIHPDGSHMDCGVVASSGQSIPAWRQAYNDLKRGGHLPVALTFAAFLAYALRDDPMMPFLVGMVTTAGVNKITTLPQALITTFNFHDSGTGTTAEAIGNTVLQTPTGLARVAGTQSNPSANVYRTVATITYDGAYNITEWGLLNAASAGTCWDRKRFAAMAVVFNGSLVFDYRLTVVAGG